MADGRSLKLTGSSEISVRKNIYKSILQRFRKHIIILSILHLGERIGIQITPYYLTSESPLDETQIKCTPKINPLECSFISEPEISRLYSSPELKNLDVDLAGHQNGDGQCFVLKHGNDILAYMWCNLHRFEGPFLRFPMQENEAFIFGVRTLSDYQGMNLAPFLRYRLYQNLAQRGYTNFFLLTEYFNAPAMKVGQKLNARRLKLALFISIFHKLKWNINLKNFSTRND
jgi:hypothetical protein